MSVVEGIVLHNSADLDCRAFMSSSRPLVYAPSFVLLRFPFAGV